MLFWVDYNDSKDKHSNVKSSEMISMLMDDYNLCDIWGDFHPNLKKYTRHQKFPKVLSRLYLFILVSDDLINIIL